MHREKYDEQNIKKATTAKKKNAIKDTHTPKQT